ncbi:glycosyltransferase family 4 protein [Cetobacterium somerae]|uniref:glycosyltransferase family 4 protein n=1 Tax=Cetobacterium somerae TaxID=188913 RepID=UPI003D768CB8
MTKIEKIKILFIVSTLRKCGPIIVLENIIKNINLDKYDITIVSLSKEPENTLKNNFLDMGCNLYNLNLNKINWIFTGRNKIKEIISKEKIDIIHSHGERADILNLLLKNKKMINLSTLHNFPEEEYKMRCGVFLGKIIEKIYILLMRKIEFISCGNSLADKIKKYYNIQLESIPNGIDTTIFYPKNLKNSTEKYIVSGSIIERKNIGLIVEAFKTLKAEVVFIGEGDLLEKYKNETKEFKNITFLGNVKDVSDFLRSSKYYITASRSEGLPNSVLEALSSGLPVIASNIEQHKEILENTKNILFDFNDVEDLKRAINEIQEQDYKEILDENINLINKKYSAIVMSKNYEKIYLERFEEKIKEKKR